MQSQRKKLFYNLKELKSDVPAVFLALKDSRTPLLHAKGLAAVIVIYALSPVDLIPDFIPILGYLDDILILPLLITLLIKMIPNQVWQDAQSASKGMWQNGKPKHWYYAIPIVLFWIVIILFAYKFWQNK
ncbi:hypothetical protein AT575_03450 [Streptococcus penaeicida]|uniref:DUF1232 domain-containing protein n=1 Tax=Streptococcus penaeicida TaxID=1765960 RepID=A0A2N8LD76_9STRE|nr:hypothetical protein AT575_03450 [Streptococcus penaeicida]